MGAKNLFTDFLFIYEGVPVVFVNKVSSVRKHQVFKSYQHNVDNRGRHTHLISVPHEKDMSCVMEIYPVAFDPYAKDGYYVPTGAERITTIAIKDEGTEVYFPEIPELGENPTFAYRYLVNGVPYVDPGTKINNGQFNLMTTNGTTSRNQGAAIFTMLDLERPGARAKGFYEDNTGEIVYEEGIQKEKEKVVKNFSNHLGGNLASLIYDTNKYFKDWKIARLITTPFTGGGIESHGYWNILDKQISDNFGTVANYRKWVADMAKAGISNVFDATLTSEGIQGLHVQDVLEFGEKSPFFHWFRMEGIKDAPVGLGVIPDNAENLRHHMINPMYVYDKEKQEVVLNPEYDCNKGTYIQIYDAAQVSSEQELGKHFSTYQKLVENPLAINSHDDTVIPYTKQVDPEEHGARLGVYRDFIKGMDNAFDVNSPEGTELVAQFANFKLVVKKEANAVTWNSNTDMFLKDYGMSGYNELQLDTSVDPIEKDARRKAREKANVQVWDYAIQYTKYWAQFDKDERITTYMRMLKDVKSVDDIENLISSGQLTPKARLSKEALENIINEDYELSEIGELEKDDVTVRALMKYELDSMEVGSNLVTILSRPHISNLATTKETLGKSRFELSQMDNPHLSEPYANTYLRVNRLYRNEVKNFADEIIKKLNELLPEKLLDENGEYTEYGEVIMNLAGRDIARYAFLKAMTGDKFKVTTDVNGELDYPTKEFRSEITRESIGIQTKDVDEQCSQLVRKLQKGLNNLTTSDVDTLVQYLSNKFQNTTTIGARVAEAMFDKASVGQEYRLDAIKDIVDWSAMMASLNAFDPTQDTLVEFLKIYVSEIKKINPNAGVIAELTDYDKLMKASMGEDANVYDSSLPDIGRRYKDVPDTLKKLFAYTGMTTAAAYSEAFTNFIQFFTANPQDGKIELDEGSRIFHFWEDFHRLVDNYSQDYIRNLYTFPDNHDKPSILHGMALDMNLFHANFVTDASARKEAMKILSNSDNDAGLPLEARLNLDNKEYFRTVSPKAIAMAKLFRDVIDDELRGVASDEQIGFFKEALIDLVNANFKGEGTTFTPITTEEPELATVEGAYRKILSLANLDLPENEIDALIAKANEKSFDSYYHVKGNMASDSTKKLANRILTGDENKTDESKNYLEYSPYAVCLALLLMDSFNEIRNWDSNGKEAIAKAARAFINEYNASKVKSCSTPLPFEVSNYVAMQRDAFGTKDFRTINDMILEQAEFLARQRGVLAPNAHFENQDAIKLEMFKASTEPAVAKFMMHLKYLVGFPGTPTAFIRTLFLALGYESPSKNIYWGNRGAAPISEYESDTGVYSSYFKEVVPKIMDIVKLRGMEELKPINQGIPYKLETSSNAVGGFLYHDGYGQNAIVLFNMLGIQPQNRFDYSGRSDEEFDPAFIAKTNKFVPRLKRVLMDSIRLPKGLSLSEDIEFENINGVDKETYYFKKIAEGCYELMKKESAWGPKIGLNKDTAEHGVMILRQKLPMFRGAERKLAINKQYKVATSPIYKSFDLKEAPVEGQKLSLISR